MFFLLRCAFWLMIVYASILLPGGGWHRLAAEPVRATEDMASQLTHRVTATAGDYCRVHVVDCLDQAAHLNALFKSAGGSDGTQAEIEQAHVGDSVPLPVRRPRHLRTMGADARAAID